MKKLSYFINRAVWAGSGALFVIACGNVPSHELEGQPDAFADSSGERRIAASRDAIDADTEDASLSNPLPTACVDPKLVKTFRHGELQGQRWVASIWREFESSCDQVEQFADVLMERVREIAPEADNDKLRKLCRYSGVVEGIFVELEAIQQQCATACFMDGDLVGALEAKAYCDLAISTGGDLEPERWVRAPVGVCGFEFEVACDARFMSATRSYVSSAGTCRSYTVTPYFELWDRSRLKSCDYHLLENLPVTSDP